MSSDQSPVGKAPLGADLVVPALALGFATYFFFSIADLAWEAKANGMMIGAVLVLLVGIQVGRTVMALARKRGNLRFDPLLQPRDALAKRVGMVLLTVVFIVAVQWLGLTLALFLALTAGLYLMGVRRRARLFWVAFAVAACVYLLFIALLDTDLPHGPVEHAVAAAMARF